MTSQAQKRDAGSWQAQYNDLVRSFTGAFLFGIPLLYTMEMWWIATYLDTWKLLSFLAVALGINIVLAHLVFLEEPTAWHIDLGEALFNLAVGIAGAAVVLYLLGRLTGSDPLREIVGKILIEAIPLSIGAAVTHRIERERQRETSHSGKEPARSGQPRAWQILLTQAGTTLGGALFLSLPLASTAEIQVLAAGTADWQILALVGFSLLVATTIIYRASLAPRWTDGAKKSGLPLLADVVMTYSIALLAATLILYLFDRIEIGNPLIHVITQVIVLGLPATVGGAAGRRLI